MIRLYFDTIRYLSIKQIIYQIIRRIYSSDVKLVNYQPKTRVCNFFLIALPLRRNSLIGPNEFCFFGVTGDINDIGWSDNRRDKLWRYNQNYFDDLISFSSNKRKDWHISLIEKWIDENRSIDSLAWDPYPSSLRIVNWIKWNLIGNNLSTTAILSLFNQGLVLEKNLEYHITGNHLFSNAKAMIFLGIFFDEPASDRWLKKGLKIINKELDIQILKDGGNYELSPMYHCLFLEDVLDLINLLTPLNSDKYKDLIASLKKAVPSMISWLLNMSFDDGDISLFNDSALNVGSKPKVLIKYANDLECDVFEKDYSSQLQLYHMQESGYISVKSKSFKIIIDVAKLGPDNLLGHAHADTLSFEMSAGRNRIFVNSGTSCYTSNKRRNFERSTKAHNTVELNCENSSEVWESFRVAKRAYPFDLSIQGDCTSGYTIACSHDGYKRLQSGLSHRRRWNIKNKKIVIEDLIYGNYESAIARYILHKDIFLERVSQNKFILKARNSKIVDFNVLHGNAKIVPWQHTNEFGSLFKTCCIEISLLEQKSIVEII